MLLTYGVDINKKKEYLSNITLSEFDPKFTILSPESDIEIIDKEGNIFKTDKATYDKTKEIIQTFENSEFAIDIDSRLEILFLKRENYS